jgi:hypothetical protein
MKKKKIIFLLVAVTMFLSMSASAAVVTFHTTAPTPGTHDVFNLVGATRDANNVGTTPYDTWLNDEWTYVALDRAAQGQTFVTGDSEPVYVCTGFWIQHVGYTENTDSGTNNNGTWYNVPPNAKFGIRIIEPSASGTDAFVLTSETYTVTGTEENIISGGSSANGSGTWIHFELATPIALAPGTTYGFDVVSMSGNPNMYFEMLGIKDDAPNGNPYSEGTAYRSGGNGVANNILTVAPGDRVFVVELTGAPPAAASIPEPADKSTGVSTDVTLNWNAGRESIGSKVYFGTNAADLGLLTTITHTQDVDRYSYTVTDLDYIQMYYWRVDELQQSDPDVRGDLWRFTTGTVKASGANPRYNEIAVFTDTDLSWKAGLSSTESKLYFGTDPDALELQTTITHAEGVDQYSYQVTGLATDVDYYWRVDETLDTGEEVTGDIWQFTTIPVIPVTDPGLVGWWKFDEGPGKVIDWSGLNQHGVVYGGAESVYGYDGYAINFDYADDYVELPIGETISTLDSATITTWVQFPGFGETLQRILNFGNNDMTVFMYLTANNGNGELSFQITNDGGGTGAMVDASTELSGGWDHVAVVINETNMTVTIYVDGSGVASGPTQILPKDLGNTTTNWLGRSQDGAVPPDPYFMGALDDFRIYNYALSPDEIELVMQIDPLRARKPSPQDGSSPDIINATPLSWTPGVDAVQNDIYFGTDAKAVADADTSTADIYRGRQDANSYTPSEDIVYNQTYYWRIDGVGADATVSIGHVWAFTVADYLLVDDFESYNDLNPDQEGSKRIFLIWVDGYDDPSANGSTIGYPEPDFAEGEHFVETDIVHGGGQSAPLLFDNSTAGISEVSVSTADLSIGSDWTVGTPDMLSLWVYGASNNSGTEQMYVKINNAKVVISDVDLTLAAWQGVTINLADFNTNLSNVTTFVIGIEKTGATGGSGMVFIDDIRLYW